MQDSLVQKEVADMNEEIKKNVDGQQQHCKQRSQHRGPGSGRGPLDDRRLCQQDGEIPGPHGSSSSRGGIPILH